MKILHRALEIHDKIKKGKNITLDEEMIYDMNSLLITISEYIIDVSKSNINSEYAIEEIKKLLDKTEKWYEKENEYDK